MEYTKKFKAYVLIDPITNIPRYVGITKRTLRQRFSGHMSDIYNRPNLNKHKTAWFKKLLSGGKIPRIEQIAQFDTEQEMKQFEMNYIAKYKDKYKLINQTNGGDWLGFHVYNRESILKKKTTQPIVQYNILGEKIAEYEMTEDAIRELSLQTKSASHITSCCKGKRRHAFGYIWRYKNDPLGDISNINPKSLYFNKLVQYDLNGNRIAEYDSYQKAARAINDHSKGGNIASAIQNNGVCKGYKFQVEPIYCYFSQELFDKVYKNWKPSVNKEITQQGYTVIQMDLQGNTIKEYNSLSLASIAMIGTIKSRSIIKKCCEGKQETYKNYKWKYKAS